MPELYAAVANLVRIFSFAIALYFFVGLVVNMAQAHLAGATGDTIGYARALQQGIAMVIMLAMAVNANAIADFLETLLSPASDNPALAEDAAWIASTWRILAKIVVTVVLGGVGAFTTVSVVWAGVGAQFSNVAGMPGGVSNAAIP